MKQTLMKKSVQPFDKNKMKKKKLVNNHFKVKITTTTTTNACNTL